VAGLGLRERPPTSRRAFVGGALAVACGPTVAQGQLLGTPAVIGFVTERPLPPQYLDAFRTGLVERGWVEGRVSAPRAPFGSMRSERLTLTTEPASRRVRSEIRIRPPVVHDSIRPRGVYARLRHGGDDA